MTTNDYLPRGDQTHKVCAALDPFIDCLFLVGSAARKKIYQLSAGVNDFDFVIDGDMEYLSDARKSITDAGLPVKDHEWGGWGLLIDAGGYEVKVRVEPLSEFLLDTLHAGDGFAVRCSDGRCLCTPEYITVPPHVEVRARRPEEIPDAEHVEVLNRFGSELMAMAAKLEAEYAKKA